MDNEEVNFRVAALLLKKYNLPVNRNTVRIHKEFFETECLDRAWKIHLEDAQTNSESILKLKDYFISKIQGYYNKVVHSELRNIG